MSRSFVTHVVRAEGQYATGAKVPASGIYRIYHAEHRLPHEVILIGEDQFPRCATCGVAVRFELLQEAGTGYEHEPVRVYELPDLDEEDRRESASAA